VGTYLTNVEASPEALLNYATVSMILSGLSGKTIASNTSAVLYYPGIFDTDVKGNVQKWAKILSASKHAYNHVLVAGHHKESGQHAYLEMSALQAIFGNSLIIRSQVKGETTNVQAAWVAGQVQELKLTAVELYVLPFHLPRAYQTIVKSFYKAGIVENVLLLPRALPLNSLDKMPMTPPYAGGFYSQQELVGGEAKKMLDYKDDVATLKELEQYLALHL
jgi:hypothetical protein